MIKLKSWCDARHFVVRNSSSLVWLTWHPVRNERMDDALDVWGVHAVGGGVGMILVGAREFVAYSLPFVD